MKENPDRKKNVRARRDRDKHGGGLMEFIKMVLSLKGLKNMRLSKVKIFVQSLPLRTGNGYA